MTKFDKFSDLALLAAILILPLFTGLFRVAFYEKIMNPVSHEAGGNRFCSSCGKPLRDGAAFCSNCGSRV